jgi:hypothetical protein
VYLESGSFQYLKPVCSCYVCNVLKVPGYQCVVTPRAVSHFCTLLRFPALSQGLGNKSAFISKKIKGKSLSIYIYNKVCHLVTVLHTS